MTNQRISITPYKFSPFGILREKFRSVSPTFELKAEPIVMRMLLTAEKPYSQAFVKGVLTDEDYETYLDLQLLIVGMGMSFEQAIEFYNKVKVLANGG